VLATIDCLAGTRGGLDGGNQLRAEMCWLGMKFGSVGIWFPRKRPVAGRDVLARNEVRLGRHMVSAEARVAGSMRMETSVPQPVDYGIVL